MRHDHQEGAPSRGHAYGHGAGMREATNPGVGTVASMRANKHMRYKLAGVSIAPTPSFVNPPIFAALVSIANDGAALNREATAEPRP